MKFADSMPTTSSEHCAPEDIGSSTVVDSRTGSRSHDLGRTLGLRPSVVRWGLARHRCVPAAPLRPRRVRKQAGITHRAPSRPCRQAPAARLAHWQGDSVKEQRLWSGPMSRPRLRLSARPSLSSPPRRHRSSSGGPLLVFPACHPGSSTNQSNCPWTNRVPFPSRDTGCGARGDGHRILPSEGHVHRRLGRRHSSMSWLGPSMLCGLFMGIGSRSSPPSMSRRHPRTL